MQIIIFILIVFIIIGGIRIFFDQHPVLSSLIIWGIISIGVIGSWSLFLSGIVISIMGYCIIVIIEKIRDKKEKEKEKLRKKANKEKIEEWIAQGRNIDIDVDQIMITVIDDFKRQYCGYYDYSNMPSGRVQAFISHFGSVDFDDEYYFFKPERTHNPYEIRENGLLIAKSGIYVLYEKNVDKEEYELIKSAVLFGDIYRYESNANKIIFIINNDDFQIKNINEIDCCEKYVGLQEIIYSVYENRIPQFIKCNGMNIEVFQLDDVEMESDVDMSLGGILAGNQTREVIYNEQKNYMNGRQGSGYAAEYGNITVDRLLKRETINEAQNLDPRTGRQVADGADRITNGEIIQTKYYKKFSDLYQEICPKGNIRYLSNGEPMKIEVPRDKYVDYCSKLQEKIDSGQINGVKPGTRANKILKKGFFSYTEACNIAKAGTIEGLAVDMTNGIITSSSPVTMSAVIVFAISIWKGKNLEEAARASFETSIQVLGRSVFIYTTTMQLTRSEIKLSFLNLPVVKNPIMKISKTITDEIKTSKMANTNFGQHLGLKSLSEKRLVSDVVTASIVFGPDICKFFAGRISGKQLFKNSIIGVGGIGGGMMISAISSATLGPLGMIAGGILGSMATKAVVDKYIEDDAIEMFCIYKEEYLDQISIADLNQEEFKQISSWTLGDEKLSKFLEVMYSKEFPRSFVREYIAECMEKIYRQKKRIENRVIENSYIELLYKENDKM